MYKASVYRYGRILDDKEELEELLDTGKARRHVVARRVTAKMKSASNRNITKAQVSRIRRREPRSVGRVARQRTRGSTFI